LLLLLPRALHVLRPQLLPCHLTAKPAAAAVKATSNAAACSTILLTGIPRTN
jgi:hypothetical protein